MNSPSARCSAIVIIATFNEADVIEHVVADFIKQGVHVFVIDDGSTDGTLKIVERFLGNGVIGIERRHATGTRTNYEWEAILRRKAELAQELDGDWFIHNDADEFRDSPWPGVSLSDAIRYADALGFNAIDSERFDFWPVHDRFQPGTDVRATFEYFAPPEAYDRMQIRCWKKTPQLVDLASSGGHEARYADRKVFPIKFVLRHYPVRSQAHGERKVLQERLPRFLESERSKGWHVQYDHLASAPSFVRDASTLTRFDLDQVRLRLMTRHRDFEAIEERCRMLADAGQAEALSTAYADVERSRTELERLQRDIGLLHAAVANGEREIAALRRSFSWRLTAPARRILKALRGV